MALVIVSQAGSPARHLAGQQSSISGDAGRSGGSSTPEQMQPITAPTTRPTRGELKVPMVRCRSRPCVRPRKVIARRAARNSCSGCDRQIPASGISTGIATVGRRRRRARPGCAHQRTRVIGRRRRPRQRSGCEPQLLGDGRHPFNSIRLHDAVGLDIAFPFVRPKSPRLQRQRQSIGYPNPHQNHRAGRCHHISRAREDDLQRHVHGGVLNSMARRQA